jgi:transposase
MIRAVYGMQIKELFIEHKKSWKTLLWISDAMNISINTLKEWGAKLKKGKDLWDKRSENGKQKTFSDDSLKLYIEENVNATLKDIWDHFLVSDVAILKRLRNMNYSYKKKRWGTVKGVKNTEMFSG